MSDIFISYAREDRPHAERLAKALEDHGYSVWWDIDSLRLGASFAREIEQAIGQAKAVVVLWSAHSKSSEWVEAETNLAWKHGKLCSLIVAAGVEVPFPFNTRHALSLASWDGGSDSPDLGRLLADIADLVGPREPKSVPPRSVEPPHQPGPRIEPGPKAVRVRALWVGIFVLSGVVVTSAVIYFSTGGPAVKPRQDTTAKPPVQEERTAASVPELVVQPPRRLAETFRDCPQCPEMVVIPAGQFQMGSAEGEGGDDERPRHEVRIGTPFAIGKTEVTFEQWDACVAAKGCRQTPGDSGWGRDTRPVIDVSWDDAQQYVAWLAKKTGKPYRLPTEAEWEYAARAGTDTAWSFGSNEGDLGQFAWYRGNSDAKTHPVGEKASNPWGLHDVRGNVWEWVQDCWHGSYQGAPGDGSAWGSGDCDRRVVRGGSWPELPWDLRSASRKSGEPVWRADLIGFRVAQGL